MKITVKLSPEMVRRKALAEQGMNPSLFGKRPGVTVQPQKKNMVKRGYTKHKGVNNDF